MAVNSIYYSRDEGGVLLLLSLPWAILLPSPCWAPTGSAARCWEQGVGFLYLP